MMFFRLQSSLIALATCAATANAALNFTGASWIWGSDAVAGQVAQIPIETIPFRKDFPTGLLKLPTSIEVAIRTDDAYTLYINGIQVGTASNFNTAQSFCIQTNPISLETIFGQKIVVAVAASNGGGPAGLIAAVKVNYLLGGSDQFVTDGSWVTTTTVPSGFQATNFDDSTWTPAVVEGPSGIAPWGVVNPPATQTCQSIQ